MRRILKWIGLGAALLVVAGLVLLWVVHEPRPATGEKGERADALARRVERSTGQAAWRDLGAVGWTFSERNAHLWDRNRDYARVRFDEHEVLLRVHEGTGVARRAGEILAGEEADAALQTAQSLFYNDSYWLNPFGKLFDAGVTRSVIATDAGEALFVEFSSGGSTPGDAYAIHVDADGRPERWEMWVSIIPIGGVDSTWEDWRDLGGGAMTAQSHQLGPLDVRLTDLRAAGTLGELEPDPFAELDAVR